MKRNWFALLLSLIAVEALLAFPTAYAAEESESGTAGEGVYWTLDSKGLLTISGNGEITSAPWRADYAKVIKQVIIEEGITSICSSAFSGCSSMTHVDIPDTVTEIGGHAFENCTSLESVVVPEGVRYLEWWAFGWCTNLKNVTLPSTLEYFNASPFTSSTNIENVYITDLEAWCSLDFADAGLTYDNLILNGTAITDLVIPEGITTISNYAFDYWTNLETVTIPESVTSIGTYAFQGCENLREVNLNNGITALHSYVFAECHALTHLTLPESILVLDSNAFRCSTYSHGNTSAIAELRFLGNAPLIASDALTSVTANAYYSANNATWTEDVLQNYGGTITWLPDSEIPGSGDEPEVYIIASGTCGANVYWELDSTGLLVVRGQTNARSVETFDMDDYTSPEETPWYAYRDQINQVVVESTVNSIGDNAFAQCENLEEVVVEEGVEEIGAGAFAQCESLEKVIFEGSEPAFGEDCFEDVEATISYPAEDPTWEEVNMEAAGGEIAMEPYVPEEEPTDPTEPGDPTAPTEHEHHYETVVTPPTCTERGYTTYTCSCGETFRGDYVSALGHDWQAATCTVPETCARCEATRGEPTDHNYVDGKCADCGAEDPDWEEPTEPTEPEPTEPEPTEPEGVIRLSGANRYATGFAVADQLKENLGVERFEAVVVAYGQNFPDALTGSYLAAVKNAPILLTEKSVDHTVAAYINENLISGGTVYILGGSAAVSESFENALRSRGFHVSRLKGAGRYETNLEILEEAGVNTTDEVLIATGKNYADSLSASATGLSMLLVDKELTEAQKEFLENTSKKFVIIGGTGAVSAEIADELSGIGQVTRIKGANRYGTSVEIAKRYFNTPSAAVLAYAQGFPDGLCGGPLAMSMNAPLILTSNESFTIADDYIVDITSGAVTGGTGRISDDTVREIFDLPGNTPIVKP